MPTNNRPLKVFLCHAHADRDPVRALYTRLTKDGVDAWLDKEKLLPGQDWELEIKKAVREADVVVVCLSKQFNQAGFRQKEVRLALDTAMEQPEGEIFIIPARLEECENLESLRKWHWVNLFEDDGYNRMLLALSARASKIGAILVNRKPYLSKMIPSISLLNKKNTIDQGALKDSHKDKRKFFVPNLKSSVIYQFFLRHISSLKKIEFGRFLKAFILLGFTLFFLISSSKLLFDYVDDTDTPMRYVMAGSFYMGGDNSGVNALPVHTVYLESFLIDKYEVSTSMYEICVDDGVCTSPKSNSSYSQLNYYKNPEFANYPVLNVTWTMARTYCQWRGARLPTEAEWEKAARGTDKREYPWGGSILGFGTLANFCDSRCVFDWHDTRYNDGYSDVSPVNSFLSGISPYGVFNMSGNVWEWVSSLYKPYPYDFDDGRESLLSSNARVLRGGSAGDYLPGVRITIRETMLPADTHYHIGFRCAKDVP